MEKFLTLKSVAAPLLVSNIDTDMIIPKQYLKTLKRSGLGVYLFDEFRRSASGIENADFILNKPEYKSSKILFTGSNFGCGSSREHAPWALHDFGIRCIIATSFADIFYNNCFKNAVLPIIINESQHESIKSVILASNKPTDCEINLINQTITINGSIQHHFEIDANRKNTLLNGLDDITITLQHSESIAQFTQSDSTRRPWLYQDSN